MRSVQPGQYPQQPYPQQPYPQQPYQGYPGYPPPKKSNTGLVVALVLAGVLLLGGLGVGAFFLFSKSGDDKSPIASGNTRTSSTSTSKAGAPDKYSTTPGCKTIEGKMNGLPALEKEDGPMEASTSGTDITGVRHFCTWSKDGSSRGDVAMYLWKSTAPGSGAGEDYAKAGFGGSEKPVTGIGKATKAIEKQITQSGRLQCGIEFYQGNINAEVIVTAADTADTNKERCLSNAKKLASATSEALG